MVLTFKEKFLKVETPILNDTEPVSSTGERKTLSQEPEKPKDVLFHRGPLTRADALMEASGVVTIDTGCGGLNPLLLYPKDRPKLGTSFLAGSAKL
jgi:hypothetical protein